MSEVEFQMSEETMSVQAWEKSKKKAKEVGLNLVAEGSYFRVEHGKTEGVYFQARTLAELDIYLAGYDYGRRDTLKL